MRALSTIFAALGLAALVAVPSGMAGCGGETLPAATVAPPAPVEPYGTRRPVLVALSPTSTGQELGSLAWHPNGNVFAAATGSRVTLWDRRRVVLRGSVTAKDSLRNILFSARGELIGVSKSKIYVWSPPALTGSDAPKEIDIDPLGYSSTVAWDKAGTWLAITREDGFTAVDLTAVDLAKSPPLKPPTDTKPIRLLALHSAGGRAATVDRDGVLAIWEFANGALTPKQVPERPGSRIVALAFEPQGRRIAVLANVGSAATVAVFDTESWTWADAFDLPLEGKPGAAEEPLAWSPDGGTIAVALSDLTTILDLRTRQIAPLGAPPGAARPGFDATGNFITLGGASPGVWGMATQTFYPLAGEYAWPSPDGRVVVTSGRGGFMVWETASGRLLGSAMKGREAMADAVMWTPDGKSIALLQANHVIRWGGRALFAQSPCGGKICKLSPDGKGAAVIDDEDKSIAFLDVDTGKKSRIYNGHAADVWWGPDAQFLAVRQGESWIEIVGRTAAAAPGHFTGTFLQFSPNGNLLATRPSGDQLLEIRDGRTGDLRAPLNVGAWVRDVTWSPDESMLFVNTIQATQRWSLSAPSMQHEDMAEGVATTYLPPGDTVALRRDDTLWIGSVDVTVAATKSGNTCLSAPFGTLLSSLSSKPSIVVWNLNATPNRCWRARFDSKVTRASVGRGDRGEVVAITSGRNEKLTVFDGRTGEMRASFDGPRASSWSPEGDVLLVDNAAGVHLLRVSDGATLDLRTFFEPSGAHSVVTSRDGFFEVPEGDDEAAHRVHALLGGDPIDSEVVSLAQLRERYQRRGLLADFLNHKPLPAPLAEAPPIPPGLEWVTPPPARSADAIVRIEVRASDRGSGVGGVQVQAAGRPDPTPCSDTVGESWSCAVSLRPGPNRIVVEARSGRGGIFSAPLIARVVAP